MSRSFGWGVTVLLLAAGPSARTDDAPPGRRADQDALKPYGPLVGSWRGVGQPRRRSGVGAWKESGEWAWSLSKDSAALELKIGDGKYLKSARLSPSPQAGRFELTATLADGSERRFSGVADSKNKLVLTTEADGQDGLRRITLTPLHETRFLLLLESQDADTDQYVRLGEVGYTRRGVAFAAGESYPLCIVTDGRGETAVSYKGVTYYVCCSGCKDLFDDDPAGVIAEAEERRKAKVKP